MGFLDKTPGGFIGYDKVTTRSEASGIWSLDNAISNKVIGNLGVIPLNGLQVYYDFADNYSYPGTGNTVYDLSGNGKNGTFASTPSFNSSGIPSVNMNNNFITGSASNSYGITNTSGYTIIMFQKQNALTMNYGFFFSGTAGKGISAHITWTDGTLYYDQGGCCDANTRTTVASYDATSAWNMLTIRRLTNSSVRHIIKNTTTLATNTASAADPSLTSENMTIGYLSGSTWNSNLGNFIVYNRGLSDEEVATIYNAHKATFGL